MVRGRAVLRLVLLAIVVAGVAGMHTLGHPAGDDHSRRSGQHVLLMGQEPMRADVGALTGTVHIDLHDVGMHLDPLSVCLATLGGGFTLLLAALGVATIRRRASTDHAGSTRAIAGRGPPSWAPLGLRLADLSVART